MSSPTHHVIWVARDEGATCPSCGWTEGITLPLLPRREKAEDEGEKLHHCPSHGSEQEEPIFEGQGCS